ncbi:MAG: patatin-like phospholipase family protein [Pirellulales bacterium]|nr:patatin-like phospholipase family protein [Pirellulales bacterium]
MATTYSGGARTEGRQHKGSGAPRSRVAIACQGGGSHTAFSAGVLQELLGHLPDDVEVVAISGTSGGAICAALAWDGMVRGDLQRSASQLESFWNANAATELWDAMIDMTMEHAMALRATVAVPEITPYQLPTWGADQFRELLNEYFDFDELQRLAREPGAPGLLIGAVEVLSGQFEVFTGRELCVEDLLASAAIPELFRAVAVPGKGVYWDGLFSQNPPIHDLVDFNINELWLIQINPSACSQVPTQVEAIKDRRNALAGNLSMEQELRFIEMINRKLAEGVISSDKFHPIFVSRIPMDRELGVRSKMSRRPAFLRELREFGHAKGRLFLKERAAKRYALKALGVVPAAS